MPKSIQFLDHPPYVQDLIVNRIIHVHSKTVLNARNFAIKENLTRAFAWRHTPEGDQYWYKIHCGNYDHLELKAIESWM